MSKTAGDQRLLLSNAKLGTSGKPRNPYALQTVTLYQRIPLARMEDSHAI